MAIWNFHCAPKVVFGAGSVEKLPDLLRFRSLSKAYVVTDQNLVKAGVVEQALAPLREAQIEIEIFDQGQAEPEIVVADQAVEQGRMFGPDVVIGLGGGSNMDVSKFVACSLTHGGSPSEYLGIERVPGPIMPLVCIPTTSGTGSEVSHASVLTDTERVIKVSCLSNYTRPMIALIDPALTYNCPRQVMADSGIDALTHAIEGYIATDSEKVNVPTNEHSPYEGSYLMGDMFAEKAIALVGQHLVDAVNDPNNTHARDQMALAAMLAGIAFSNAGVALVHAMEYPLGAILHCSHGGGNGLLLPFVMEFTKKGREEKFGKIAELLGNDTSGLTQDAAAQLAIDTIHQLKKDIGVPQTIRDLGGTEDQIPTFAEKAFKIKRLLWYTPRETTLDDITEIYQAAF